MKKSIRIVGYGVILLVATFCMCVCLTRGLIPIPHTNERLQQLNNVDCIEIRVFFPPNYEPVYSKKITDPQKVNAAVEKIRSYADYWFSPVVIYFSPQLPVEVAIRRYEGIKAVSSDPTCTDPSTEILEVLSIGNRNGFPFMATWSEGRYLSTNEFKALMAVLDADENCARLSHANPTCNTDGFIEEEPFPAMPK